MTAEYLDVLWKLAAVVFAAGAVWQELRAIRKDIARLEEKVEKHNHFDRRLLIIESRLGITGEEK
jgi:uncharacterized membrane protein